MPVVTEVERLRRNLHPVEVVLDGEQIATQARVTITNRRAFIHFAPNRKVVTIELKLTGEPPTRDRAERLPYRAHLAVETTEGTLHLNPGRGCGCTSATRHQVAGFPW